MSDKEDQGCSMSEREFVDAMICSCRGMAEGVQAECAIEALKCTAMSIALTLEGRPIRAARLAAEASKCAAAASAIRLALTVAPGPSPLSDPT